MTIAPDRTRTPVHHWPGLDVVPSGPRAAVSARVARRLFAAAVSRLDVTVIVGDHTYGRGGPVAVVHRPEEFFARLGRHQLIGFGEAYLTGAWDAEDLGGFLEVLAAEMPTLVPERLQRLRALVVKRPPRRQRSSTKNSRNNIAHHYDLSNDLFDLFLDPTLSYSSALFDGDPAVATRARPGGRRRCARSTGCSTRPASATDTRVLEIGSGWGELAHPRRPPRRDRPHDHALGRAEGARRRAGSPPPAAPTGSRSSCATTATSPASSTPSCRSR